VEFGNVLWKYLQKGYLHPDEANEIWNRFEKLGIEFREDHPLVPEAIKIGHESGLTVYDSLCAVLAQKENAVLVTADKKLYEIASSRKIEARFLNPPLD
jgi:predicted nucleic acid-binding protein